MSGPRSRGRGIDQKGRSRDDTPHVRLQHWVMKTAAWRELRPVERCLVVELYSLFNGINNGELFLSIREAAKRLNVSKDTAHAALRRLEQLGFIRAKERGMFTRRRATSWILTQFMHGTRTPTKDFARWRPDEK